MPEAERRIHPYVTDFRGSRQLPSESVVSKQLLRRVALGVGVVTILVAFSLFFFRTRSVAEAAPLQGLDFEVTSPRAVQMHEPAPRTVDAYRGLGAWVDGFDYSPAYSANGVPAVAPTALDEMATAGVQTLYLQSGRLDDRSPELVEDRWVLTEFLMRADQNDIDVVAWYLPKWGDDTVDLDHLMAAHNFEVLGYKFDGVAVDIEWNQDGLDPEERKRTTRAVVPPVQHPDRRRSDRSDRAAAGADRSDQPGLLAGLPMVRHR